MKSMKEQATEMLQRCEVVVHLGKQGRLSTACPPVQNSFGRLQRDLDGNGKGFIKDKRLFPKPQSGIVFPGSRQQRRHDRNRGDRNRPGFQRKILAGLVYRPFPRRTYRQQLCPVEIYRRARYLLVGREVRP